MSSRGDGEVGERGGQRLALFFALGLGVLILCLTLWPLPEFTYRASLSPVYCLVCGDQGLQGDGDPGQHDHRGGGRSAAPPVTGGVGPGSEGGEDGQGQERGSGSSGCW